MDCINPRSCLTVFRCIQVQGERFASYNNILKHTHAAQIMHFLPVPTLLRFSICTSRFSTKLIRNRIYEHYFVLTSGRVVVL